MAGGRILEAAPAREFFESPKTEQGKQFLRTGSCSEPSPAAQPEELEPSQVPAPLPAPAVVRSRFEGPRNFFWVLPGQLGGLPRPGIVETVKHDLDALKRLGVTHLVTLEETKTVDPLALEKAKIDLIFFPIIDMGVPELAAAEQLCKQIATIIQTSGVVALHCRSGLGRTGTLLACQLIFGGETAHRALERVRRIIPRAVQSQAQVTFLSLFEAFLGGPDKVAVWAPSINKQPTP